MQKYYKKNKCYKALLIQKRLILQDITNCILTEMNSTKLISTLFKPRQAATALYATQAEAIQAKVFKRLIKDAANTEWGIGV